MVKREIVIGETRLHLCLGCGCVVEMSFDTLKNSHDKPFEFKVAMVQKCPSFLPRKANHISREHKAELCQRPKPRP